MYLAGLDTSSQFASFAAIASSTRETVIDRRDLAMGSASAELVVTVKQLLDDAQIDLTDIRQWHLGTGPGSFTGIRIGIALILGVCAATGAAYRGVPTSLAMAIQSQPDDGETVGVLHDGRQDEAIMTCYRCADGVLKTQREAEAIKLVELSNQQVDKWVILSSDRIGPRLPALSVPLIQLDRLDAGCLIATPGWGWPDSPTAIARGIQPIYVRPAVFLTPKG